jgi:hypothetical protein
MPKLPEQANELEQLRGWCEERLEELQKKHSDIISKCDTYRGAAQVNVSRVKRDTEIVQLVHGLLGMIHKSIANNEPVKLKLTEANFATIDRLCFPRKKGASADD